ncbi:aminodeoxychorismate synthase component I [Calidifontibacillus erzurumensis]|uniref:Aminodeoxychorismate synthase component I n=1 Tax=Calidifontibacillus erzurumensis TaxID=2741433 RepID=A0A8J8GEN4_9BACI|nr:aminodeoxychorismate synthase component I [Calidifontibacillus erzurumensis]NSL52500.1 aminodeoxychorismate synthase component I [Calidifontibacillus erzurumensis]
MKIKSLHNDAPILSFEFANFSGEIEPLTFCNPIKIIAAHQIEDVVPCLQMIQEEVQNGFYAAGFLSYESAPAFDKAFKVNRNPSMPFLWFGIFSEPVSQPLISSGSYTIEDWHPTVSKEEYQRSISSIKSYIASGDTYQVNYTIRLYSQFEGDDIAFFQRLKKAQSSNYCAYINTMTHSILSASPELFFHYKNDMITTRPMKGTAKRGLTFIEDEAIAKSLYFSEKNRAENVMIVDLLRNDLGTIAEKGTVQVPKLFEIERYPTVHQMTSTVTAKVPANIQLVDMFKALFPCGSITGAPKVRTMEIIEELEQTPRDVYCGAIGFITPNKEAVFNVPIRTIVIHHETGKATYGVGGGITWDSTAEDEYDEVVAKARLLKVERSDFQLLESLLLQDGKLFLLNEHLNRLQNSAHYFGYPFNKEEVQYALNNLAKQHDHGEFKVRFLLSNRGEIMVESQPIMKLEAPLKVVLADEPIEINNPFLYHKTTNRDVYTYFQKKKSPDAFDILLWNKHGEITEFTNGNIVLEIDGICLTPPVKSGLLAGTFREALLKNGEIQEKRLTLDDLKKCSKIWFINSVRKWLEVELIE